MILYWFIFQCDEGSIQTNSIAELHNKVLRPINSTPDRDNITPYPVAKSKTGLRNNVLNSFLVSNMSASSGRRENYMAKNVWLRSCDGHPSVNQPAVPVCVIDLVPEDVVPTKFVIWQKILTIDNNPLLHEGSPGHIYIASWRTIANERDCTRHVQAVLAVDH